MRNRIYFTILVIFLTQIVFGQVNYTVSYHHAAGNPGGLNAEGDLGSVGWTGIATSQISNQWTNPLPVPFPFVFYGDTVSTFRASQNGIVTFSNSTLLPNDNTNLPSNALPPKSICGFWDKFYYDYYYNYGWMQTKTFGTQPNRQFWISYTSWPLDTTIFNTFATVLEEGTNKIYVVDMSGDGSYHQVTSTVGIQLDNTTAKQYGSNSIDLTTSSLSNLDNNYYEFKPETIDDAGITALVSPTIPITPGLNNVDVTLTNFGINQLDSVMINWEINGVLQPTLNWTTGGLAPDGDITVSLGSFNISAGNSYDIKIWTELPNGNVDNNDSNDELNEVLCIPFQGTYTVGGSGADFPDLTSAVHVLECGIDGPVVFNVNPGIYNEAITINEIYGASATNTVTFIGDSSTISYNSDFGKSAVVEIAGADYVTFDNFTIINDGYSFGWGFLLWKVADHITISNCEIKPATWGHINAIVASASYTDAYIAGNNCNFLTVDNCKMVGSIPIILTGSTNYNTGNKIVNSHLTGDFGLLRMTNQDNFELTGNILDGNPINYSLLIEKPRYFKINSNFINIDHVSSSFRPIAIEIYEANTNHSPASNSEIVNNMIFNDQDKGIYIENSNHINVFHNTIKCRESVIELRWSNTNINFMNNVFNSWSGTMFRALSGLQGINSLDYNLYFNTGAPLFWDGSSSHSSINSFHAAHPQYAEHSVYMDPQFTASTDLHINNPAANNLALPITGITDDFDGDSRPSPNEIRVDMGADEFNVSSIDIQPLATSLGSGNILCNGIDSLPIEVILTNYGATTSNVLVEAFFSGAINTSISYLVTAPLYSNLQTSIFLGNVHVIDTGTVNMTIISTKQADTNTQNDTLQQSINLQEKIHATATVKHETILGANDGEINMTSIGGGVTPYTFIWNTGQTTFSIANLAPGNYTATITDAVGCQKTISYEVLPGIMTNNANTLNEINLSLYPNPTHNRATLEIALPITSDVNITLLSSTGQVIRQIEAPQIQSHTTEFDLSQYPTGVYFIKVSDGKTLITKRLVLIQ